MLSDANNMILAMSHKQSPIEMNTKSALCHDSTYFRPFSKHFNRHVRKINGLNYVPMTVDEYVEEVSNEECVSSSQASSENVLVGKAILRSWEYTMDDAFGDFEPDARFYYQTSYDGLLQLKNLLLND